MSQVSPTSDVAPVASSPETTATPLPTRARAVSRGDVPEPSIDRLGWTAGDRLFLWLALSLAAGLLGFQLFREAQRRAQPVAVLSGGDRTSPMRDTPTHTRSAAAEPVEAAADQPSLFRVEINSAEWAAWTQLPGIGETLARRIVTDRAERGPFRSVEDVARVRGIGPKTLDKLRPFLAMRPPAESPGSESPGHQSND